MQAHKIVSRKEWIAARKAHLAREKEHTRARDRLNAERRALPWVRVEKNYQFEGPGGTATLADLFGGRSQLVVQHFMFDPSWEDGCSSCTAAVDELSDGLLRHLGARSTTYAITARAPLAKLEAYRAKRGWTVPLYSSFGSDFNYDFHVSLDAGVTPVMYNYRDPDELRAAGQGWVLDEPMEQPGMSCFLRDGDDVFHTYSTFGRGTEQAGDSYGILDMTALGRQEAWEEPKGRADTDRGAIPDFS